MSRDEHLQKTISHFRLKLKHTLLCTGMTPQRVDYALHRRKGWTQGKLNKLAKGRSIRLRDVSDIGTACGVEFTFNLEDVVMPPVEEVIEQLLDRSVPIPESGCWIWLAGVRGSSGYGAFCAGGKAYSAHRISYEAFKAPIPKGLFVCHTCDQPLCINPEHLWTGTNSDNMIDRSAKGRCNVRQGEGHHWAKLTNDQVVEIIADSRSLREIAAQYGISQPYVSELKRGLKRKGQRSSEQ